MRLTSILKLAPCLTEVGVIFFTGLASGCNPLAGVSSIDIGFNPGVHSPVPFVQNFTLNQPNAGQFHYNASSIDFTANTAELTKSSSVDNGLSQFSGGSKLGVVFDSNGYTEDGTAHQTQPYLRLDQSGSQADLELDQSWTPAFANLLSYWKLNEGAGAGTALDSTLGAHALTLSGGVTQGISGKFGSGAYFDGSGEMTTAFPSVALNVFSFCGWVNLATAARGTIASTDAFRMEVYNYTAGSYGLNVDFYNNASYAFSLYATNNGLPQNTWNQVCITYDGITAKGYQNGALVVSQTGTLVNSLTHLHVGSTFGSDSLTGSLDELSLWNTSLSEQSIHQIYEHQMSVHAGTFTSGVMDSFNPSQTWPSLGFITTLPFLKALPDQAVSETQSHYTSLSSSTLMSGIVGLWHLDESAGTNSVDGVVDQSGNSLNGTPMNVTFGQAGRFSSAASFNGTGYILTDAGSTPLNSTEFTISTWVNTTQVASGNKFIGLLGNGTIWLTFANGAFQALATDSSAHYAPIYTSTLINDGVWHHLVVTANPLSMNVYIDGKSAGSNVSTGWTGTFPVNGAHYFGSYNGNNSYAFSGLIDEFAIWSRALPATEILDLYRRGSNRLKYQVRTCLESTCLSGAPVWRGPDNTDQSNFSELNNTLLNTLNGIVQSGLPLMDFTKFITSNGYRSNFTLPANRYFQYRTLMESDDTGISCNYGTGATWCSPELKSVSAGADHYDPSAVTISNSQGFNYQTLRSFVESLGGGGCTGNVVYNLSKDNSHWYYWVGGAWVLADGTSLQANQASIVNTNIEAFGTQLGSGTLYFKAFLQSSGYSGCELSAVSVGGSN